MAIVGLNQWVDGMALDTTNMNADRAILEAKFNKGITADDISDSATITNSQLSNYGYEFILNLSTNTAQMAGIIAGGSATIPVSVISLPGDNATHGTYEIVDYSMACTCCGDAGSVTTWKVEWGSFTGVSNVWVNTTTIISAVSVNTGSANIPVYSYDSPATTITLPTNSAQPRFLALFFTAAAATFLDDDGGSTHHSFTVSLRCRRTDGLRTF